MTAQDVNLTITDGALGQVSAGNDNLLAIIGCSSTGTAQSIVSTADPATVISTFGYGPLSELACYEIARSGGPVLLVKVASNTAGSQGSVTHTGTGTSVVTTTGAAYDVNDVVVLVTTGGTIGTSGSIQISLDNGVTYGPIVSLGTANSYSIPHSGVGLAFAAGTLVAGDTYTFTTVEPLWTVADITSALALLVASTYDFAGAVIAGKAAASDATTIDGNLSTYETTNYRYLFAICNVRDHNGGESEATWMASVQSAFSAYTSKRVMVGAGHYRLTSAISGAQLRRPATWPAAARLASVAPQVSLGRVKDGALTGVSSSSTDSQIYHDERVNPGLDASKFMTLRTYVGKPGWFVSNPYIMSAPGSDFSLMQYRRVMDKACRATRNIFLDYLQADVRLDPVTGFILEKDASDIEKRANAVLGTVLVATDNASAVTVTVSRVDNISSTKTLTVTIRVLPKGYANTINVNIGFTNPALGA